MLLRGQRKIKEGNIYSVIFGYVFSLVSVPLNKKNSIRDSVSQTHLPKGEDPELGLAPYTETIGA